MDMAGFWLMFGLDIYTKCLRHPLSLNKEAWGRSHHIYCLTLTSAFPLQSPSRPKVINNDECGFFPVHIWDRWRVTVDNNSLQARALTWLFKKTLQMLTEKQGTKFCGLFFHICLLDDRFLQRAVTGLPTCMRISAVAEQHLCLREMMDRFSAWFSLSLPLPSFPNSHFPRSLYPLLHLCPLLLMLSASQHARLWRHRMAGNKCLS